jgi:hypothetical protein
LAELAGRSGLKLIWGEATELSAPFYSHVLNLPGIDDLFFIGGETLERKRCQSLQIAK